MHCPFCYTVIRCVPAQSASRLHSCRAKTVVAKIENGKREDGFSGCTHGRILVFEDNTGLRCAEYNYEYAYRPNAFIFVRSSDIKVCIEGYLYDVNPLR